MKTAKIYFKFSCIYCGQHMECEPRLIGRQLLCPVCRHRIVIPTGPKRGPSNSGSAMPETWDTWLPMPSIEIPTRYRRTIITHSELASAA